MYAGRGMPRFRGMAPMHSILRTALGAALLLALVVPTAASAAKARSQAIYEVTFRAQMTEQWQMTEHYEDDCQLTGNICTRDEKGAGNAKIQLKTRRPFKMLVMRGIGGQGPRINVGTGEGAPITGSDLRVGTLTTTYAGAWDAGNPDREADTTGCGEKIVKGDVNFVWEGRNRLRLSPVLDDDREDCPIGPSVGFDWPENEAPAVTEVIAHAQQTKFLRARQFTVSGTRSWTGTVPPISQSHYTRSGTKTVRWHWEATFRMASDKKKKRKKRR